MAAMSSTCADPTPVRRPRGIHGIDLRSASGTGRIIGQACEGDANDRRGPVRGQPGDPVPVVDNYPLVIHEP